MLVERLLEESAKISIFYDGLRNKYKFNIERGLDTQFSDHMKTIRSSFASVWAASFDRDLVTYDK